MENRIKINNTDLEVSRINLGGNVFGWTLDEQQSFEILDTATANGINFIDTADTYSWWVNGKGGQSETIIGNWLKESQLMKVCNVCRPTTLICTIPILTTTSRRLKKHCRLMMKL